MTDFKFNGKGSNVWDKDSLRRTLVRDYPGASNVQEALSKARELLSSETKTSTPVTDVIAPPTDYEIMRDCIKAIEAVYDPSADYDPLVVAELSFLPLKTPADAFKWRDAWLELIKQHSPFQDP